LGESLLAMKAAHTIIVVTNNPELFKLADLVIWIDEGKVKSMGAPDKVGPEFYGGS
jgi:ABC-type bacteriocin/lantibiotic exporter with double-glycine peptidase domain